MTSPTTFPHSFLLLSPYAKGGGETIHVVNLSLLLREHGKEVAVVVQQDVAQNPEFGGCLRNAGVSMVALPDWYRLPMPVRIAAFRGLALRRLWAKRFDVLIANGTGGSHYWFQRFLSPQGWFVWHDHSDGAYRTSIQDAFHPPVVGAYPKHVLRSCRRADVIITGTEDAKRRLREVQGLQASIAVLPPLLRISAAPPLVAASSAKRRINVGCFGRLEARKGIEALLRIWADLVKEDPNLCLHFYGSDPGQRYERIATALGLLANVRFHGAYTRSEVPALFGQIDMALMTSVAEGFGMVALEYMAHGVPFVMTDVGAARALTAGNPDAILAPLSPEGVKRAITEMVRKVRQGEVSPRRLQQRYREQFAWDVIAPQYLAFFAGLSPRDGKEL